MRKYNPNLSKAETLVSGSVKDKIEFIKWAENKGYELCEGFCDPSSDEYVHMLNSVRKIQFKESRQVTFKSNKSRTIYTIPTSDEIRVGDLVEYTGEYRVNIPEYIGLKCRVLRINRKTATINLVKENRETEAFLKNLRLVTSTWQGGSEDNRDKYKVGDRVEYIGSHKKVAGKYGTVRTPGISVMVDFDNGNSWLCESPNLRKIEEDNFKVGDRVEYHGNERTRSQKLLCEKGTIERIYSNIDHPYANVAFDNKKISRNQNAYLSNLKKIVTVESNQSKKEIYEAVYPGKKEYDLRTYPLTTDECFETKDITTVNRSLNGSSISMLTPEVLIKTK